MLTKHITTFLLAVLTAVSVSAYASRSTDKRPNNWVPFPWAKELPFTWSTAQGVWTVGTDTETSYFYIRVTKDKVDKTMRYLTITERDRATCGLVATGFGTEKNNNSVIAEMKYVSATRSRYLLMLRLYDPKAVPRGQDVQPFKGKVMVMTINPEGSAKTYNYPMTKVSDRTEYPCIPTK